VITETENFLLRKLFFLNKKHSEREEDFFLEKKKKTENIPTQKVVCRSRGKFVPYIYGV
jgi:hypothetical protein